MVSKIARRRLGQNAHFDKSRHFKKLPFIERNKAHMSLKTPGSKKAKFNSKNKNAAYDTQFCSD